ncbi:serine hydrolase domain-containing protein [Microbacterium sp. NPDC028030]|uniref:serine hydrolase domain-containing protein n=1 Tax=Microbacterium sp. NPDC028030 TaxID=3155124 RepID=UPI0033D427B2
MQLLSSRRRRAVAASAAGAALFALILTGCTPDDSFSYTPPAQVDGALPDDTVAAMQGAVDNALVASGASGAIVGVWVPWSGSWVTAFGTQGRDGGEVTTDMSFRIADVTRLMTCDVLYALADEGTVELDANVADYVSGVGGMREEGITLLDLCNGTSGAGSSESSVRPAWLNTPERVWAPLELAGFGLARDRVAPHTTFRDSDSGYLLLGLALERASGLSASELIAEYVTDPLELTGTSLPGPTAAPPGDDPMNGYYMPGVEGGYSCAAPTDITTLSSSTGFTDSGVVSTIADLGRYAQAEAKQALRTEDEPDRFGAPLPVAEGAPSWYQATGGAYLVGSMIGQHGWVPGYATAAYSDPATGFTVAVVLNDSTLGAQFAQQLSWELAAIASKAPAASGQTVPEFGLPFTAEQYHKAITDAAVVCVEPAAG